MASPFKIPKKKSPAGPDSSHLHPQSPLSRLQSPAPQAKGFGDRSYGGRADRMHAGNATGSSADIRRPPFRQVVKTLLGLNSPNRGGASAGHQSGQSQPKGEALSFSNGWRLNRASDRLLPLAVASECLSPPMKKKNSDSPASSLDNNISVASVDSLAELRGEEHPGSSSAKGKGNTRSPPLEPTKKNSAQSSEDDFVSPSRTRPSSSSSSSSASSSSSSVPMVTRTTPNRRWSLDRKSWLTASVSVQEMRAEQKEKWVDQREKWVELMEKKKKDQWNFLQPKKRKQTLTEPIVLSSEEEEEEDKGDEEEDGNDNDDRVNESQRGNGHKAVKAVCSPPPSFLQLDFSSLHAGLMDADANGKMTITEHGITLPVKVLGVESGEDGEVTVVASQLRGFGFWDGGLAQGGALLAKWKGPAPSLLFLWVTEAQANLLHRELLVVQTAAGPGPGPPCSFLLLLFQERLEEIQAALLLSLLDTEEYRQRRSSSFPSPLNWSDGLLLLHSCPPPLDRHLLGLLRHSPTSRGCRNKPTLRSAAGRHSPTRLIQYPVAPCKGRITVTMEDLACLKDGEFLNDVIIDFYLKYLLLEGVGGPVAGRSHVFSTFFYKQLSRRRAAGEDDAPFVPDRHTRHQRVKTWTRHVDIFSKDFLFVPVNQEAHWFLVVVCFPGLDEIRYEDFQKPTGGSEKPDVVLRSQQPPECSEQGWKQASVLKRPCILVMDSLKVSSHENVCRLIRDYLQVEWEVHRTSRRAFTTETMKSSNVRVLQQENSSDCGIYLLQFTESFLQNPVVHFELPLRLDGWFPRQRVRQKREELHRLIMELHRRHFLSPQ